jgi:hypothetical protein
VSDAADDRGLWGPEDVAVTQWDPAGIWGPYETSMRVYQDACGVFAVTLGRRDATAAENEQRLTAVLAAAGVRLGARDHEIVRWLAGWEPDTVQVVLGWLSRARRRDSDDAQGAGSCRRV